jgi:hypothetical protein
MGQFVGRVLGPGLSVQQQEWHAGHVLHMCRLCCDVLCGCRCSGTTSLSALQKVVAPVLVVAGFGVSCCDAAGIATIFEVPATVNKCTVCNVSSHFEHFSDVNCVAHSFYLAIWWLHRSTDCCQIKVLQAMRMNCDSFVSCTGLLLWLLVVAVSPCHD